MEKLQQIDIKNIQFGSFCFDMKWCGEIKSATFGVLEININHDLYRNAMGKGTVHLYNEIDMNTVIGQIIA